MLQKGDHAKNPDVSGRRANKQQQGAGARMGETDHGAKMRRRRGRCQGVKQGFTGGVSFDIKGVHVFVCTTIYSGELKMNFGQAIAAGFGNFVKFSGRSCRSEYWYWALFTSIVVVMAFYIDVTVLEVSPDEDFGPMQVVANLVLLLPSLGVLVRRLHDIGRSGWWCLIVAVPLVGVIVLILWACKAGDADANRFGPSPFAVEHDALATDAVS